MVDDVYSQLARDHARRMQDTEAKRHKAEVMWSLGCMLFGAVVGATVASACWTIP